MTKCKKGNSMNVILGLCHSYSGTVVTFQESLFACKRKLSKTSRLLRRAEKFYLSVSHVIAVVRRAVTQPRRSGQLPVLSSPTKKTCRLRKLAFTSK